MTRHRGGTRSRQTGTVGRQGCIDDTEADINLLQLQMMGLCTASPLTDGPGPVNSRIASSPIVPTISGRLEDGADEREASWVDGTPSPPRAQLLNRLRKVRDVIQNTTVAGQSHAKTGGEGLRRRAKMVLSDSEVDEPGCVGCPLNELSDCESENADISSCSECSSVSDALPCVDDEAKDAETDSDVLDDNSVDESSSVECVSVSAGSLKRLCLGVAMAGAADPRRMPFSSKELDENDAGCVFTRLLWLSMHC